MSGFLGRLFKVGRIPPELEAAMAGVTPLVLAQGVIVRSGGKLKTPTRRSTGFTAMHHGVLVVLPGRVLASFGSHVVVDDMLDALAAAPGPTSTTCTIDAEGLHVHIDVPVAVDGGTGHVDIAWRAAVPPEALAALSVHSWSGRIAAADPAKMFMRI